MGWHEQKIFLTHFIPLVSFHRGYQKRPVGSNGLSIYRFPKSRVSFWQSQHCVKSVQIRSFFWSVFSHIRTEYGDLQSKSPHSVQMREDPDRKKLSIWTLFTQYKPAITFSMSAIEEPSQYVKSVQSVQWGYQNYVNDVAGRLNGFDRWLSRSGFFATDNNSWKLFLKISSCYLNNFMMDVPTV